MPLSFSQVGQEAEKLLLNQIGQSVKKQVDIAVRLSPVSTEATRPGGPHGELKKKWKLSGGGKHYTVSNSANHATFQEIGTRYQSGREMLGLRSGKIVNDIINRVKI